MLIVSFAWTLSSRFTETSASLPFTDFTGPYMFHCHIGAHEDNGMMSFINVVAN